MNNIPDGYKLVPVEPTAEQQEAGCQGYMLADGNWCMHASSMGHAYKAMLSAAPAPPQPIYDEAKERELFAEFSRRIVAHDAANFPIRWCDCVPDEEIEEHLNTWLACAQSSAKAGEDE